MQGDRWFESPFLQRRVCLCSALQGFRRRAPHFCGSLRRHGDERRDVLAANRPLLRSFSLTGVGAVPPWKLAAFKRAQAAVRPRPGISVVSGSAYEQSVLLGPVERQVEFGQSRCGELDGLPALQDHVNELWAQEGEVNKAPDVAPGDAVALGQLLQRSGAAGRQLLKPCTPARDRLDQRRITFRARGCAAPTRAAPAWFQRRAA